MRLLFAILILFVSWQESGVMAQTYKSRDIQPDSSSYSNVYVKKLHSDDRSSIFAIWVKKSVKAHRHDNHTEVVTVLSGKGLMTVDGVEKKIQKGDVVIIPQGTSHSVITTSRKPLKVISVQSPVFLGKDRIWIEEK